MFKVKTIATNFNKEFEEGAVIDVKEFGNWDETYDLASEINENAIENVFNGGSHSIYACIERIKTPRQKLADAGDKMWAVKQNINTHSSLRKIIEEAIDLIDEVRDDLK